MGFVKRFFKNTKEIKAEDILSFISQKIEENVNLDYKDIKAYDDPDKLASRVAGFANSDGGLIILGVAESKTRDEKGRIQKIYPEKITWGDVSLEKEKLENQLTARIQPQISGLVVKPIRNENDGVIFLIDIPKSSSAPHMSSDHVYHKRMNFRVRAMEHYEVAGLFRTNWTLKQKLVESIYEPLASTLEKHARQFTNYHCPDRREVEDIMSRTYYKAQMPVELLDGISHYVDRLTELDKEEHLAQESVIDIASRNITDYLKKKYGVLGKEPVVLDYVRVNTKPRQYEVILNSHLAYELLLSSQNVSSYVSKVHWRNTYEEVSISHGAQTYCMDLHDFDELVWDKCLKEAHENPQISGMINDAEDLSEEAWDLIEKVVEQ